MKLLFDHHLSPSLTARLADLFPHSSHVWHVHLHDADDSAIWLYAREHGFTVVSKDADFLDLSIRLGAPPKLIWLRIDNWTTAEIEEMLRANSVSIAALEDDAERAILALHRHRRNR